MTYDDITRSEKTAAGALAVAMHIAFFAVLFVSVSWQQMRPDSAAIVDLWSSLPPLPQPRVEPPPPPEVKPEPPRPLPRVEPKPEPKPLPKPDIALKEKEEKERKLKEQKALEEKKRLAELKKKEQEKKLAALKAQKEKEAEEAKRREAEFQAALRDMQAREAAASAQAKATAEYVRLVSERIKRYVVLPPNLQGNPQAEFEVVQIPGGEVLSVRLRKSSGVPAYDAAVERAIRQAQPLPAPPAPLQFSEVRELNLRFRPKE